MDPLGDPLTTHPIQTGWEFTIEPYPNWRFGFIDNPDRPCGNYSVWTCTRTRSDSPGPLVTLYIAMDSKTSIEIDRKIVLSVSNGSGPALQVRVWVGSELSWPRWSLSLIYPNSQIGYGWMAISHPVWNGQVVSRLSRRTICRFIQCSCFWCLIIVSFQNRLFNTQ